MEKIPQYEIEINKRDMKIINLRQKNQELSDLVQNLEKENIELRAVFLTIKNDKLTKNQNDTTDFMEKELKNLKEDMIKKEKYYEDKLIEQQHKFEKDFHQLKNLYDTVSNKADVAATNERLCETQKRQIEILKKEIDTLKSLSEAHINKIQLSHELKFSHLKDKMQQQIKDTQKKITQLNLENMDVSTKLILLQNHQLLIELEYQTMQCEELVKKNSAYEKKVYELQKDIETHEQVENTLASKNKTLLEIIKKNNYEDKNPPSTRQKIKREEFLKLKKNYEELLEKLQLYENKYNNIFNLFENGLEKLCEDYELKEIQDIYINIDSIRSCDFSDLNGEQKYSVLVILIKHLLPLINISNTDNQIRKNVKNVKLKFEGRSINIESAENKIQENKRFIENLPIINTQKNFFPKKNYKDYIFKY